MLFLEILFFTFIFTALHFLNFHQFSLPDNLPISFAEPTSLVNKPSDDNKLYYAQHIYLLIFVDMAKQPNQASIFVCITFLIFKHLRRVWRFRTESPEVSFCSTTQLIGLPWMDLANPTICLRQFDETTLMLTDSEDTIYCRSAHRQLKQLLWRCETEEKLWIRRH